MSSSREERREIPSRAVIDRHLATALHNAERRERRRSVKALTEMVPSGLPSAGVFERLRLAAPEKPVLALLYAARLKEPLPVEMHKGLLAALALPTVKAKIRVAAASKLIASVEDDPRRVELIVRAVTQGFESEKAWRVIRRLVRLTVKSESLDAIARTKEAQVRIPCPECSAVGTVPQVTAHLWKKHRLFRKKGTSLAPGTVMEQAVARAARLGKPRSFDRVFHEAELHFPEMPRRDVFQALASRGAGADDPTQFDRLLEGAAESGCGLCPVCVGQVPDRLPKLPPPATLANGRLAAEGYEVEVRDETFGRVIALELPGKRPDVYADPRRRRPPRAAGIFVAAPILLITLVAVVVAPFSPLATAAIGLLLAWPIYGIVVISRTMPSDHSSRAVTIAWDEIVPDVGRSAPAIRFLTRLCRTSLGRGVPGDRSRRLFELAEQAEVLSRRQPAAAQLHATAKLLQAHDAVRLGKDKITSLLGLFDPFLRGDVGAIYVETVAEIVVSDRLLGQGDLERLGLLIGIDAFDRGWKPADLVAIFRFCPWLRNLFASAGPDYWNLVYILWRERANKTWQRAGRAACLLTDVNDRPARARRDLRECPDALLRLDLDPVLGSVYLTGRGVVIGGQVLTSSSVEIVRGSRGGWTLQTGPHRFSLRDKPNAQVKPQLKAWIEYHTQVLLPAAARIDQKRRDVRVKKILEPLLVACPLCGTVCIHRVGRLGTPKEAIL